MKTPKIFAAAVIGLASLAMTSCEDWLTIYPQNKLTDEQFWEDMNDLEGVRYAAYRNFASGDAVKKILAWGEFRSDNLEFTGRSSANDYGALLRITDGRLDTASGYNDWATFYTTINYCNQVLHNGEKVLLRDPQFSATQWRRIKAEMISLRALNYFYLVRAFGNVPYVNKVIKTDAEVSVHRQSFQSDILDSLIVDVDAVKDDVRLYYANSKETRGLITKPFPYALLADLCMWRAAKYEGKGEYLKADSVYKRAYDYAVRARVIMDGDRNNTGEQSQYMAIYNRDMRSESHMGQYFLSQNFAENVLATSPVMSSFIELFDEGFSDEVIFEMPFTESDEQKNSVVNSFFGYVEGSPAKSFYSNYEGLRHCCPYSKANDKVYDLRLVYTTAYHNANALLTSSNSLDAVRPNGNGYMMKYAKLSMSSFRFEIQDKVSRYQAIFTDNDYRNFIIYRKSDVLFIEAEAIALMHRLKKNGGVHYADVDINDAKWIVEEHRRRNYSEVYQAKPSDLSGLAYMPTDEGWDTPDKVLANVLDEKQIEFVGEGRRWFDIVRYMERNGAKADAISAMFSDGAKAGSMYKHDDRAQRYKSNLRARWAFYNPVYYPEREASGWLLYQNPYWDDDPTNNDPVSGEPVDVIIPTPDDTEETPDVPEGDDTEETPDVPEGDEPAQE